MVKAERGRDGGRFSAWARRGGSGGDDNDGVEEKLGEATEWCGTSGDRAHAAPRSPSTDTDTEFYSAVASLTDVEYYSSGR